MSTIQERDYVHKEKGSLVPLPLGRTVNRLLAEFFPRVIDVDFTARMEEGLDRIEEEENDWVASLREFYGVLQEEMGSAKTKMKNLKQEEKETSIICDKCGKHMILRWGKNGEYLVCSGRPACKNKKNVTVDKDGNISIVEETTLRRLPPVRRHPGRKERPLRPFHRVRQLSRMQVYKAVHHGPPLP